MRARRRAGSVHRALAPAIGGWALAAVLATAPMAPDAGASPYVDVHLSVKVILDPVTGARPPVDDSDPSDLLTDQDIQAMFAVINTNDSLLAGYWRGYRFVLDEIVNVGTPCPSGCVGSNPSMWYDVTFCDGCLLTTQDMENAAIANPTAFQWRTNAVNVYINKGKGDGAVASFPPNHIVIVGSRVLEPSYIPTFAAATFTHELGHYFNLPHPNKFLDTCCDPATCIADGDGIGDTVPDGPCFNQNYLALFNYGLLYAQLNPVQKDSVDYVFWNNMSYLHPGQPYGETFMHKLTEGQLDRWTDTANDTRAAVRSGRTRFVKLGGTGTGSSTNPYGFVFLAVSASAPGDIVLIRPGTYNELLTLNSPVTLRATRAGPVRIGQ